MPALEKIRVLIVDDIAETRDNLKRLLQFDTSIEVIAEARTGREAIDLANQHKPDVILMDINLPGISGIQALRILAEDPTTAHIPVVALSANAIPRDIEKGLQAGFFRYLTKPIKVNEFMDTLDVALKFARAELVRLTSRDLV